MKIAIEKLLTSRKESASITYVTCAHTVWMALFVSMLLSYWAKWKKERKCASIQKYVIKSHLVTLQAIGWKYLPFAK